MARLKEGVSLGRASGEIAHLVHQIERSEAGSSQRAAEGRNALVRPLRDDFVSDAGSARFVLLGVCSCVLLIVTANLAGLFVARGAARERDLAIRRALGASRLRLARQILAEPVMISLLGGGLALLLANWGMELSMSHLDLEGLGVRAGLDVRILVFVLALAIVVGVASGLASASRLRLIVEGALFQGDTLRTTASRGRVRVQRLFIGAQVACALVLLSIAGMFAREYVRLRQADPGLDDGSLAYGLIQTSDTSAAGLSAFVSRASSSIGEIAGVAGSTLIGFPSFDGSVIPDGRDQPLTGEAVPLLRSVGPDFFEVLGIRVRAGRVFASTDGRGTQRVAIVNELAANRYWPQGDAVGHTIQLRTSDGSSEVVTVVGVVADTRLFDPLAKSEPIMYRPIEQAPGGDLGVFVRAPSSRYEVLTRLRATIATLVTGPTWADGVYWIDDHFSQLLGRQRFVTRAMLAFSLLGIGLAALGVYGLAAQAAAMRTREVGIRIALGAQRHALVLAACKETAIITAAGVGTGVAWSWVATRLIRSLLAGTAPADPRILLSAALLLAAVVMLAGYGPAVRLTRVDPVTALRAE
jgi:putative ABC transport system permease protein